MFKNPQVNGQLFYSLSKGSASGTGDSIIRKFLDNLWEWERDMILFKLIKHFYKEQLQISLVLFT